MDKFQGIYFKMTQMNKGEKILRDEVQEDEGVLLLYSLYTSCYYAPVLLPMRVSHLRVP